MFVVYSAFTLGIKCKDSSTSGLYRDPNVCSPLFTVGSLQYEDPARDSKKTLDRPTRVVPFGVVGLNRVTMGIPRNE